MTADPEKERFLKEFGHDYGYPNAPKNIDQIRATEFKRLNGDILSFSLYRFSRQKKKKRPNSRFLNFDSKNPLLVCNNSN